MSYHIKYNLILNYLSVYLVFNDTFNNVDSLTLSNRELCRLLGSDQGSFLLMVGYGSEFKIPLKAIKPFISIHF